MHLTSMQTSVSRALLLVAGALAGGAMACGAGPGAADASTGSDTGAESSTQDPGATGTTGADAPTTGASSTTAGPPATSTSGEAPTTGHDAGTTSATSTSETTSTSSTSETTGTTDTTGAVSASTSEGSEASGTDTGDGTGTGEPGELGVISGECGLIDAMELESPQPFVFTSAIDFGVVGLDESLLTPGGMQIVDEGGLNNGSLYSEVIAYEVLARCDMASLLKTETTIVYKDPMGKKTDLLVELDGLKVGVSVVRAIGFPKDDPYTVEQATTILKKKLTDISLSSANVAPEDAWVKQILSVVAYAPMHVDSILTAYAALDAQTRADTVLVISVTNGDDAFIYNP